MAVRRAKANPVEELVFQCKAAGLPEPVREFYFARPRRWRADLVFPRMVGQPLMVEVEGGVYLPKARHTTGIGFENDCIKYAEAMIRGFRVLRVTPRMIRDGRALHWIESLLKG